MATTRLRLILALAALAAPAAALPAQAATGSRYTGKLEGAGPVSFVLTGGRATHFQASAGITCSSSSGGQSETFLLVPAGSAKVDGRGGFTLRFTKAKQEGGPFPLYKIDATVRGTVSGSSARGTLKVTYYKNLLVSGRLTLMGCGSGTAAWTARRV